MALKLSSGVRMLLACALVFIVVGKFAIDWYVAPVADSSPIPMRDHKPADPRTNEELERLRFGEFSRESVQEDCDTWVRKNQWRFGRNITDIREADSGSTAEDVQALFRESRTNQISQYLNLTQDPESVRPTVSELLQIWANLPMDTPDNKSYAQIAELAERAIESGSTDPLVRAMRACYQTATDDPNNEKLLAELPNEISEAGYNSTFRLFAQKNRFKYAQSNKAVNLGAIAGDVIEDIVAYSDEFSANSDQARVAWFSIGGLAALLQESEQRDLYRELLISDKTNPLFLHLLAGSMYRNDAWNARGQGTISTVRDDAWPRIMESFQLASQHYRQAWLLRPDLPHAPSALIEISNVSAGQERWSPRQWFELSCRAQPDYMIAYSYYIYALLPRWGGTHEDVLEFGKECAATKAFDTPIPYVFINCVSQIAGETRGATTWDSTNYVQELTTFWKSMDEWGDTNDKLRKSQRWQTQYALRAAVMIRNNRFADARTSLDLATWPLETETMVHVLKAPELAASMAYALSEPDTESLIETEKKFGQSIEKNATIDELKSAFDTIVAAKSKSNSPRASLYFGVRETSLQQQLSFLEGKWVDLNFDNPLTAWTVQGGTATVESPTSLLISNRGIGRTALQAIPNCSFSLPYSVKAKLERIREESYFEKVGICIGPASQANMFGGPGGMAFITNDQPRVAGTFWPSNGNQQWYYIDNLQDTFTMQVNVWQNEYQLYVNGTPIPVLPVNIFTPNTDLSFGGNPFEGAEGQIRISNVQVKKLTLPPPPDTNATADEKIAYMNQAIEMEPDNLNLQMQLATILQQLNRLEDALLHYERIFKKNPDYQNIKLLYGNACFEAGLEAKASPLLMAALESEPDGMMAIDAVAWFYATALTDNLRNGQESLRLATKLCDRTQNIQWNLTATKAAALAELQRFPEALTVIKQAIKNAPENQHALLNRMQAAFEKQQPWRREE